MIFREYNGGPVKYWSVEIRFDRRLTRSEVRRLAGHLGADMDLDGVAIGEDGVVSDHWPHDWPGANADASLVGALRRFGMPCRVCAAPAGRDCAGRWVCPEVCADPTCCPSPRCTLGGCGACAPVFTEQDWQRLDFAATGAP